MDITDPRYEPYFSQLVDSLVEDLGDNVKNDDIDYVVQSLPTLLKAFALRFAQNSSSKQELYVVVFIHKFRAWVNTPSAQQNVLADLLTLGIQTN